MVLRLLVAAILLCGVSAVTSAHAAVRSLPTDLLTTVDRPSNHFFDLHGQRYPRFATEMHTGRYVHLINVKNDVYCYPPSSFRHLSWKDGLIESFDTENFYEQLVLCAYLFASPKMAHSAYAALGGPVLRAIKAKQADTLTKIRVGNESSGYQAYEPQEQNYFIAYRSGNSVIALSYKGLPSYDVRSFVALAERISARLH